MICLILKVFWITLKQHKTWINYINGSFPNLFFSHKSNNVFVGIWRIWLDWSTDLGKVTKIIMILKFFLNDSCIHLWLHIWSLFGFLLSIFFMQIQVSSVVNEWHQILIFPEEFHKQSAVKWHDYNVLSSYKTVTTYMSLHFMGFVCRFQKQPSWNKQNKTP